MCLQEEKSKKTNSNCWYKDICESEDSCNLCVKYTEMSYMMENSNLPKAKQQIISLDIPETDESEYMRLSDIKNDMYEFVKGGKSLYIGSHIVGNGKSSWAIKMMHKYFEEMWDGNGLRERALFIHVPSFMMQFKNFKSVDEEFERLKKLLFGVDLVVWDDITGMDMSSYDYSVILSYIDYRSNLAELSNIYTGNATTKEELADILGIKLASRIMTKNTEVVIFNGGTLR